MKTFNELTDSEKFSYRMMIQRMIKSDSGAEEIAKVLRLNQETIDKIMDLEMDSPKVIKPNLKPQKEKRKG